MRVGPFDFRPALWPTLATLLLLPVLIGLGNWQLERAKVKQALVDTHASRIRQSPVPLGGLLASSLPDSEMEYRQVTAQGAYDLDHQLLLDNRTYQGAAGYQVLTPFHLEGTGSAETWVLVNRGWVPLGDSRKVRPAVPGPANRVTLRAMIQLPPEKLFRLGSAEEAAQTWPRVVQQLEVGKIDKVVGYPLLPLVLLLDPDDPGGFVRDWRPVYGITPDKHRAYAAQWYTLAFVLVLIYVGVNTHRVTSHPADQEAKKS